MSRNQREAIVLVIDCGKSMSRKCINWDKSVFESSKQCLQNIIRQKIFAETKNEYLLIELNGDPEDSTGIAIGSAQNGRFTSPNFHLLQYIINDLKTNQYFTKSNLMNALNVAINTSIQLTKDQKFSKVKIVLFTDFSNLIQSDLNTFWTQISPKLQTTCTELIILSDLFEISEPIPDLPKSQVLAQTLMKEIEAKEIGTCFNLISSIEDFSEFEAKQTYPNAWYSDLRLGNGVNSLVIPIGHYTKAQPYKRKTGSEAYIDPSSQTNVSNDLTQQTQDTPIDKSIDFKPKYEESFRDHPREDVVKGYPFGQTLVPFSEDDKKLFKYDKNEKGYKIIGFTSKDNIHIAQRVGDKIYYVFPDPRPSMNNHKFVFQTLAKAMIDKNEVAIVRYNWSANSNPQIGYLLPLIEDDNVIFVYTQLPFDEDVRKYRFPSLESKTEFLPTERQLEAIDSLIDSMDLMNVDDCEALKTEEISDPVLQYWFQSLYYRKMNGLNEELPPLSEFLKDVIETPKNVCQQSLSSLKNLSEVFILEYLKDKSAKRPQLNSSQTLNNSETETKRVRISEEDSDQAMDIQIIKSELNDMIETKESFDRICNKFNAFLNTIFADKLKLEALSEELMELIEIFRKESLKNNDPKHFNDFMFNLKQKICGTDFWWVLLAKEIRPIGPLECPKSLISQQMVDNYTNLSEDQIKLEN